MELACYLHVVCSHVMDMQKHESAFTLIELMIAIAVAAVVLTLGVPGFGRVIERNQLTAHINELVSTLRFARSEAIRRNGDIPFVTVATVLHAAVWVMKMAGLFFSIVMVMGITQMQEKS